MAATTAALFTSLWLRAEFVEVAQILGGNLSDTDEEWWKIVKSQFPLQDGLIYFNH